MINNATEFLEPFLIALRKGDVEAFDGELEEIPLAIVALQLKIQEPMPTQDFESTICRLNAEIESNQNEINRLQRIPAISNDRCIEISDECHNLSIEISILKEAIHILDYSSIETIRLTTRSW